MSKFFKALERAAEERAMRPPEVDRAKSRDEDAPAVSGGGWEGLQSVEGLSLVKPQPSLPNPRGERSQPLKESGWAQEIAPSAPQGVDPRLVSLLAPTSLEAEQYRTLRYMVEGAQTENGKCRIVAVSSAAAGDGKTTTAINLAGALAQGEGARVLLVDTDIRHPSATHLLGLAPAPGPGLVDAILIPGLALPDVVRFCPAFHLSVLPVGRVPTATYEVLKSARLGALFEEARGSYDYIVLDTPPLVPLPDCRLIAEWVDSFLIVVAAHKTPRRLVEEALQVVTPSQVLGLVFNGADPERLSYYYGYGARSRGGQSPWWRRAFNKVRLLTGAGNGGGGRGKRSSAGGLS